jgi:hypothetical protein
MATLMGTGVDKMKIITILIGLMLLMVTVNAAPPVPMPVIFGFTYQGQPVNNLVVDLYFNDEKITRTTNEQGMLLVDVGTGSPDFATARTVNSGTLRVVVLGVDKSYNTATLNTPYQEIFTLSTAPPATCPSCPSCGGGGSGGAVIMCTQQQCVDKFPSLVPTTCPISTPIACATPICPVTSCPSQDCPTPAVCETTPTNSCPDNNSPLGAVIAAMIVFIAGYGIAYLTLGNNKVRVKKVNGAYVISHQHPLVSGYHSPDTMHKVEPHKKGELVPKYAKDSAGKWHYQG